MSPLELHDAQGRGVLLSKLILRKCCLLGLLRSDGSGDVEVNDLDNSIDYNNIGGFDVAVIDAAPLELGESIGSLGA